MIPRFLSVDPVTAYEDPIGAFHRYRYVNNNPYRFTDPDGRDNVLGVVANFPKNFGKPVESDLHIQAAAQRSVDLTVNAALNGSSAEIKQNVAKWSVTVDPRTPLTRTGGVASTNVDTVETTYSASIGLIADTSGTVTLSGGIKAPGGDPALLAIGGHEIGHTTTENKALPPGEEKERNASQTAIQISATSLDVEPGTIKPTADRVQR